MSDQRVAADVLWAKWSREDNSYHPLLCHMLDVAAVTFALWLDVFSPATRREWAQRLGMSGEEAAGRWISFWAGLHDIGKASLAFQWKVEGARQRLTGVRLPCHLARGDAPHGTVSADVLPDILTTEFLLDRDTARTVAMLLGGHHGTFPTDSQVRRLDHSAVGKGSWAAARLDLARRLFAVLDTPRQMRPARLDGATAMALAGLVSVADWIGSNESYFPHLVTDAASTPAVDERSYLALARARAVDAITGLGWLGWSPPSDTRSVTDLFPAISFLRPLQRAVEQLAPQIDGPGLVIVEAPMGEGKTEAALFLADYWSATLGQRGMYVTLPTMATSNQMFTRVTAFLKRRYPADIVNTHLLHGHASLSEEYRELKCNDLRRFNIGEVDGPRGPDGASANVIAAEWFTARKRSLLAPFGVGTVDQALMSILQVRHGFVRLFGLGGKTVIIDEVHAYDAYMSTLLNRLLMWLGALPAPVVLLSATLSRSRRDALAHAYASGAGWPTPVLPAASPYPRITWTAETTSGARSIATSDQSTRRVSVVWLPGPLGEGDDLVHMGVQLANELGGGGCAAVVCNTVRRAQQIYQALRAFFPGTADDGEPELDLLHARYLVEERARRETRVLRRFGKDSHVGAVSARRRPRRAVLVATQIIEQSLDIDFDLVVSELAPADLVLQRSGRLYRHDRPDDRPAGFPGPRIWIMRPTEEGGLPCFGRANDYVYGTHVLLRSWLALRDRDFIAVPDDIEALVEAVYDERPCPEDQSEAIREMWEATRAEHLQAMWEEEQQAKFRYIKPPASGAPLYEVAGEPREEDAPDLHPGHQALTRLIEPTIQVAFLYGTVEQPTFDEAGRERVPVTGKLDARTTRRLLGRSVAISDRRVVSSLFETPAPGAWKRSAVLRKHRLLILRADHTALHGAFRLRLDEELGVVIEPATI